MRIIILFDYTCKAFFLIIQHGKKESNLVSIGRFIELKVCSSCVYPRRIKEYLYRKQDVVN
jgi:hypothetical protein